MDTTFVFGSFARETDFNYEGSAFWLARQLMAETRQLLAEAQAGGGPQVLREALERLRFCIITLERLAHSVEAVERAGAPLDTFRIPA